jgi:hypothetical protein
LHGLHELYIQGEVSTLEAACDPDLNSALIHLQTALICSVHLHTNGRFQVREASNIQCL